MYDQVLILPDGGIQFMQLVRLAALYSDKLHVYAPTKESTIDEISAALRESQTKFALFTHIAKLQQSKQGSSVKELVQRLTQEPSSEAAFREHFQDFISEHPLNGFVRTSVANRSDLELLEREGVAKSILEELAVRVIKNRDCQFFERFVQAFQSANAESFPALQIPAYFRNPTSTNSSVCMLLEFLLEIVFEMAETQGKLPKIIEDQVLSHDEMLTTISVGMFFLMSSYYALENGCAGMTWDAETQKLFDSCTEGLTSSQSVNADSLKREVVKNRLGKIVLEDQVPDVSTLPLGEILEIRRKRQPELLLFRNALRELTNDIDRTTPEAQIEEALDSKLQTTVRPALDDLTTAIREHQIEIRKHFSGLAGVTITGVVTVVLSALAGSPVEASVQLSALGATIARAFDIAVGGHYDNQKLLTKCPWSILLDLQNKVGKQ